MKIRPASLALWIGAAAASTLGGTSCDRPPAGALAGDPPPLKTYLGRRIATTMHWRGAEWLIRHEREREEAATLMLDELEVRPGQTVCDLGSGNGYHALPLAERVGPQGRVMAVDIQPEMLALLRKRADAAGIKNIQTWEGTVIDPRLPPGEVDLVLMVDVYHEFSHPVQMLRKIRECLRPGGLVVLVEFRAEDRDVPIQPDHKMSKAQIRKELTANGFRLVRNFDGLPWQHMMFFARAEEPYSAARRIRSRSSPWAPAAVERGPDPRVFHTPMIFPHRLIIPPLGPGRVSVFGR